MPSAALLGARFYKMSGSGNDFVMFDGREIAAERITTEDIVELCDRRHGIGADGLVVLTPDGEDRVRMDFWNCDGSRADMCGNAALCSTRLATRLGMVPVKGMRLVTRAGTFPTRVLPGDSESEINLPDFPLPPGASGVHLRPGESGGLLATVGVPHLILEVDNLESPDLMDRGRALRFDPVLGPGGANVNFVSHPEPDRPVPLRTYERGVEGETLACGTGAVAAAVLLAQAGRARLPVRILTRGGRVLHIGATLSDGKATDVWLSGEGRLVFTGTLSALHSLGPSPFQSNYCK